MLSKLPRSWAKTTSRRYGRETEEVIRKQGVRVDIKLWEEATMVV